MAAPRRSYGRDLDEARADVDLVTEDLAEVAGTGCIGVIAESVPKAL